MSSDTSVNRILGVIPGGSPIREFVAALGNAQTYNPWKNAYTVFGFLWGIPVPVFALAIDILVSKKAFTWGLFAEHPWQLLFLVHPFMFAIVFGAMGTVRWRKDRQIVSLVEQLERHGADLEEANDRLKDLDRLKGEFMANVTHELKTPLVAIRGYTESILEKRFGPLTDKQQGGLEVALRNVDRLQALIEELLEFERIESGKLDLKLEDFDVVPLVESAVQSLNPRIERKQLKVEVKLEGPLMVCADREKIGRVFLNLVSNAVKFLPEEGAMGVRGGTDELRKEIWVEVWDHGPGIPTAAQKYLFTRFWQADGSSRRVHGGTGLGLAIVKGIMDAHGAEVRVDSRFGEGTSVRVMLPIADGQRKEEDHGRAETAHPGV